jgi:ribosomal protein S18 acetylase RimI-like enzyme
MDLLVRLYDLPSPAPAIERAASAGVEIRPALAPEKHVVTRWVAEHFSAAWASECEAAFAREPVACLVAVKGNALCGFAAHEATCRGFFGPLGVHREWRGQHLGAALTLAALHSMRARGYGYAIIGSAGPVEFFRRLVDAQPIAGSEPGVYRGLLRG